MLVAVLSLSLPLLLYRCGTSHLCRIIVPCCLKLGLEGHCCWEKLGLGDCCCCHRPRLGWGSSGKTGVEKRKKKREREGVPSSAGALVSIQVSWSSGKAGAGGWGVGVGTIVVVNALVIERWWSAQGLACRKEGVGDL